MLWQMPVFLSNCMINLLRPCKPTVDDPTRHPGVLNDHSGWSKDLLDREVLQEGFVLLGGWVAVGSRVGPVVEGYELGNELWVSERRWEKQLQDKGEFDRRQCLLLIVFLLPS